MGFESGNIVAFTQPATADTEYTLFIVAEHDYNHGWISVRDCVGSSFKVREESLNLASPIQLIELTLKKEIAESLS